MRKSLLHLILVTGCVLLVHTAEAQNKKQKNGPYNKANNQNNQFLRKQWWVGIKAGSNVNAIAVDQPYAILAPTDGEVTSIRKKYDNYHAYGSQVTLEGTFYFSGFSLSIQPTYQRSRFVYENNMEWTDSEQGANRLTMQFEHEQKVEHLFIPLLVKYEFGGTRLRPYFQIGGYWGRLINANKTLNSSGTDYASGGELPFKNEPVSVGATDLFAKNHYGVIGGAGVYYNLGNIRVNLDVQYKYGMTLINSTQNRYGNDRLSGIGDAMDDIRMNSITVSAGVLFPLRFLSSGFKSMDVKK